MGVVVKVGDRDMGNSSFERGLVVTLFNVDMFMPADPKLRQCFSSAGIGYKLDTWLFSTNSFQRLNAKRKKQIRDDGF